MIANGNGQPLYRLEISGVIQKAINDLISEAYLLGIGPEVRRALNTIFYRLKTDPLEFDLLIDSQVKT